MRGKPRVEQLRRCWRHSSSLECHCLDFDRVLSRALICLTSGREVFIVHSTIEYGSALIQRGGGTGPMKPQQPPANVRPAGANSGSGLEDERTCRRERPRFACTRTLIPSG